MKRREFVERLGLGSAAILAGGAVVRAEEKVAAKPQAHDHAQVTGPLAAATVSFGQWKTPLNRFPTGGTPPATNQHLLLPYEATIKAGGSVMFVIAGFHHIAVYGPGTTLESINETLTQPVTCRHRPDPFPPLINDPTNRVYRGLIKPFPAGSCRGCHLWDPGRYLVIFAFLPHFLDNMHGFVERLAVIGRVWRSRAPWVD